MNENVMYKTAYMLYVVVGCIDSRVFFKMIISLIFSIISILKPKIRDEVATGKTISNIKILISTFGS